jgi:glucose-1-phosphate thymidylyltransferase
MKGIVLAGGTGSRLSPLTKVTNKHLLPVGRAPMICHPVSKLTAAGIEEILVVTGVAHSGDVVDLLGSGKDFGCRFTYKVQDEAGGVAQALGLAEGFAAGEPVCVILGDNIFEASLAGAISAFERQRKGARLLLKRVPDPGRYGVAEVRDDVIVGIEEKPKRPSSDLAVTGIYLYDGRVYDVIRRLRPSARGELEITDVNKHYLSRGELQWELLEGWWTDAGTFGSLLHADRLVGRAEARAQGQAKAQAKVRVKPPGRPARPSGRRRERRDG